MRHPSHLAQVELHIAELTETTQSLQESEQPPPLRHPSLQEALPLAGVCVWLRARHCCTPALPRCKEVTAVDHILDCVCSHSRVDPRSVPGHLAAWGSMVALTLLAWYLRCGQYGSPLSGVRRIAICRCPGWFRQREAARRMHGAILVQ